MAYQTVHTRVLPLLPSTIWISSLARGTTVPARFRRTHSSRENLTRWCCIIARSPAPRSPRSTRLGPAASARHRYSPVPPTRRWNVARPGPSTCHSIRAPASIRVQRSSAPSPTTCFQGSLRGRGYTPTHAASAVPPSVRQSPSLARASRPASVFKVQGSIVQRFSSSPFLVYSRPFAVKLKSLLFQQEISFCRLPFAIRHLTVPMSSSFCLIPIPSRLPPKKIPSYFVRPACGFEAKL